MKTSVLFGTSRGLSYLCIMIELSRHIEALLLTHDCVIVPGLGGFVTQYVPAYYVEEENLFIPPHRTIAFNAGLSLNDGLLVESYMKRSGSNYADAVAQVRRDVQDLLASLEQHGEYELQGLGTLTRRMEGTLIFTPADSGAVTPHLYGLGAFSARRHVAEEDEKHTIPVSTTKDCDIDTDVKDEDFEIPRRRKTWLNRDLYNYVAAAVVAIVFYFLWATPLGNPQTTAYQHYSGMGMPLAVQPAAPASHSIKQDTPQCSNPQEATAEKAIATPDTTRVEQEATDNRPAATDGSQTDMANRPKANNPAEDVEAEAQKPYYVIVLASAITTENAEQYVTKLQREGYEEAEVLTRRKMVRVVYGHYATAAESQTALNRLRHKSNEFDDAWTYEVK